MLQYSKGFVPFYRKKTRGQPNLIFRFEQVGTYVRGDCVYSSLQLYIEKLSEICWLGEYFFSFVIEELQCNKFLSFMLQVGH